jgi:hypothetical protein
VAELHVETAFLFVMSNPITISLGRSAGTQYKHNGGNQGQAQYKFFHDSFQIGYAVYCGVQYNKLIKEIPEDCWGRVQTILVENENTTRILLLIVFRRIFLFTYGKTTILQG